MTASQRRALIKAYVTEAEKEEITALARQARLSVSELARRLITGLKLPDTHRYESILALVRINADLARLGNLLRFALSEDDFKPPDGTDLNNLIDAIRETQAILKAKVKDL